MSFYFFFFFFTRPVDFGFGHGRPVTPFRAGSIGMARHLRLAPVHSTVDLHIWARSTGAFPSRHNPSASLGIPRQHMQQDTVGHQHTARSTFNNSTVDRCFRLLGHAQSPLGTRCSRSTFNFGKVDRSFWLTRQAASGHLGQARHVTVDLRFWPRWTVGQFHPGQIFAQPDAHMLRSTLTILQGGPVPPQIFCLGHMQPTVNRWKNPRLTGEFFFTQFTSFCSHSHITPTKFTHPCTY